MGHLTNPQFRRRLFRRMMRRGLGESTSLGTLTAYLPGEMGRRSKMEGELIGPHDGGWLWSQRTSVLAAVHAALRATSDADFHARENVGMALVRLMPMAPHGYWDTRSPTWPPAHNAHSDGPKP